MEVVAKQHRMDVYYIAWEIDETCADITKHHWQRMQQRGNIFQDTPESLAKTLEAVDLKAEFGHHVGHQQFGGAGFPSPMEPTI